MSKPNITEAVAAAEKMIKADRAIASVAFEFVSVTGVTMAGVLHRSGKIEIK